MYLKQIDLLGFKSFPTKTMVRFSDGVTAIVGPNGCGKTNVLDALRWVLGEQKPTLLRGGKMEEVIFSGTRDMKPLGMAEVTLTIVNNRGVLPTEYHELQITRRLFRSGESEYLINKVPCRLKDITDLFADTGLGAHSYSVIQQHMIDSVISDKAEERRFLFEEAAGITKYKQRRKAALRKLEATENDFLRLKDVYAEVKTRVNSLHRQHKKAERYQTLTERIKAWELHLGSARLTQLKLEKRELDAELEALGDQRSSRNSSLDLATGQLEAGRSELIDIERKLTEVGEEVYQISENAHRVEREISVLNEKKTNAHQLSNRNQTDIGNLNVRSEELTHERETMQAQVESQNEELGKTTEQLARAQAEQARCDQLLLDARAQRETEGARLLDLEGRLSTGKAEESNLREQTEELADMSRQLDEATSSILPRQRDLILQVEKERSELDRVINRRSELEHRQTDLTQNIEQGIDRSEELALELSNLKAAIEAGEARRNLLEDMMLHYEGYESGVVTAMESSDKWPQLVGTVADHFTPVEGMENVLQAALGEMSKFLICHDRREAEAIVAELKSAGKGRVGILVPRIGTISAVVKRPEMDLPGVVGWLDAYVSTDEKLRPLMEATLSRTVVFEAGADIDPILERLPYGFGAVSTDGVLFRKNLVSGGSEDDFPLFRRKEKVAEQDSLIEGLQAKIAATEEHKNKNTAELAAQRADLGRVVTELGELAEEIENQQRQLAEAEFASRSLTTEFERLTKDKQQLSQRLENVRGRQYSLGLDANELASQKKNLVGGLDDLTSQVHGLEGQASGASDNVSQLQVSAIEARSRVEQTEHRSGHLQELLNEIESTRSAKMAEIEQARADIDHSTTALVTLEADLKQAFDRRDERQREQEQLRTLQTELMDRTTEQEAQVKRLRSEKEAVAEKLHQTDIRHTTTESEIRTLIDRVLGEYEIDLTAQQYAQPEEKKAVEDPPALIAELREKLRNFGAVNLLALEEYDVANEREKFLGAQLADLTTAKTDLKATITKINKTAHRLFAETFTKVQENFSMLFLELFAGGEARISLVDPDDPLESDIDIIARPGGKKLLPITMLSGGERALTAISLLFSLYLVKPSPFCILDEIDAPLDDANCQRFLKIIRKFSEQTQFITITHNKITMEASNNLYGITMERPGVSKLVAVKFAEGEEGADAQLVAVEDDELPDVPVVETDELPKAIRERINPGTPVSRDNEA